MVSDMTNPMMSADPPTTSPANDGVQVTAADIAATLPPSMLRRVDFDFGPESDLDVDPRTLRAGIRDEDGDEGCRHTPPPAPAYVDDDHACGEPHPDGGTSYRLRAGHQAHARPATAGFDAWWPSPLCADAAQTEPEYVVTPEGTFGRSRLAAQPPTAPGGSPGRGDGSQSPTRRYVLTPESDAEATYRAGMEAGRLACEAEHGDIRAREARRVAEQIAVAIEAECIDPEWPGDDISENGARAARIARQHTGEDTNHA